MREITIRYTYKRKSDGHIWQQILPIECLEGKGDMVKVDESAWDIVGRDLFTGLKDKNGNDVFDGDICSRYGEKGRKVYWHNYTACWRMEGYTGMTQGDAAMSLEVIGNVYQNSELSNVK